MRTRRLIGFLALACLGYIVAFYLTGWWLRRQWSKLLETP